MTIQKTIINGFGFAGKPSLATAMFSLLALLVSACSNSETPNPKDDTPPSVQHAAQVKGAGGDSLSRKERDMLNRLTKDINAVRNDMNTIKASVFTDPKKVEKLKDTLVSLGDRVQAISENRDLSPDAMEVVNAKQAFQQLRIDTKRNSTRAKMQVIATGDPQGALKYLDQNITGNRIPRPPLDNLKQSVVQEWVFETKVQEALYENAILVLQRVEKGGKLPKNTAGNPQSGAAYDEQDWARLSNHAARQLQSLQNNLAQMQQTLALNLDHIDQFVGLTKGPHADSVFKDNRQTAQAALFFENAMGRDGQQAKAVLAKIMATENNLVANQASALSNTKLPKAKSKDKKRLKIAKQILAIKKYQFEENGPIILITDKITERERKETAYDEGTMKVWTYKWDEFKFVTPIKDKTSDDWHLWTITAKKFSSGGRKTPLGKWVSGKASKGPRILKENF